MSLIGGDVISHQTLIQFSNSNKQNPYFLFTLHRYVAFVSLRPRVQNFRGNFRRFSSIIMQSPILLSVNFRGECKLVSVVDGFSFNQFVGYIIGKWVDLHPNQFSAVCKVGDVSGVCLDNDYDLSNLILLARISEVKVVQVKIVDESRVCVDLGFDNHVGLDVQKCKKRIFQDDASGDNSGVSCGDVVIIDSQICKKINVDHSASYGMSGLSGQQPEYGGIDNLPCFDVCPTIKRIPLLSDGWGNIMQGGVGLVFKGGVVEFRTELIKYTTKIGFRFQYVRNEGRYVHVVCKEDCKDGCQWFIKARRQHVTNYFEIYRSNTIHSCVGKLVDDTSRLGSKLMGVLVLQKVKASPTIGGREIIQLIKDSYGIEISYSRAWRTIEAARSMIFGSYEESYDQLSWYCEAILQTNPGSVADLEHNMKSNTFERVFIAFKACIDGFRGCRPMLFLDGTFMKGRAKGTLLSATAKDGNNGLFPVAFAVVSAENKENWIWFLEKLRATVKHEKVIIYISDRNCGLMAAFPIVFQDPVHFFCLYHLLTNLKGRFSTGWTAKNRTNLGIHFKDCAYAPNMRIFEEKLVIFKELGGSIAEKWLSEIPFEKWAVAFSPHITRYGEMTSNAAESFNSWIRQARALPITYMIDSIKEDISTWYVKRRQQASTWSGALCFNKEVLWNSLTEMGRSWFVSQCSNGGYKVASSPTAFVDTRSRTCSCYQWQVRGFPCAHAVAVIRKHSSSIYEHVEDCFFAENYKACYSGNINFIPETQRYECQNSNTTGAKKILPPILNRPPGRPKRGSRISSFGEFRHKKAYRKCTTCGKIATHDSTTCATQPSIDACP